METNTTLVEIQPLAPKAIGGGLEGAERTSRETVSWNAAIISPDRQINAVKDQADARARDSVQNDGFAMGAVNTHRDGIVGAQYRLNSQPDFGVIGADEAWAEEFQQAVESRFNLLADSEKCWLDASRMNTFTGMIRLGVVSYVITGEVLATAEWLRAQGRPCRTAIQMVSPTRLCNPDGKSDDRFLRRGVAKDFYGAPIGYWFRKQHPGDFYFDSGDDQYRWSFVPAEKPWGRPQVLHIIEQLQPDQTRGIADMVSALKKMKMTKKFQEVTLQNAVVNATYAAAIESELPREAIFGAMGAGGSGINDLVGKYLEGLQGYLAGTSNIAIDGVKMPHLYPGTKLNLQPMGTPGGVGTQFEESLMRNIAAPLGLSYEEFSRDFTKTNYSSARASMGQTYKFYQGRKKAVADRQANFVLALWMEEEVNAGNLPLPRGMGPEIFYDPMKREALLRCEWIGAARGQIDELKETEAAVLRINSNLSTHEKEAARMGEDWRRIFRQRNREQKMMKELDLQMPSAGAAGAAAKTTEKTTQKQDDEL